LLESLGSIEPNVPISHFIPEYCSPMAGNRAGPEQELKRHPGREFSICENFFRTLQSEVSEKKDHQTHTSNGKFPAFEAKTIQCWQGI
jgi:hypothetical protein